MNYTDMLGRRGEILKRNIGSLILKGNKHGLNQQERNFYQHLVKEMYQNQHELDIARKND